jgi:hypothetical protein
LQRRLLGRLQEVDAGCQNRPHRVGYDELVGELVHSPGAVLTLEHAPVDQRANELLDEERIALRPLDDDVANAGGQLGRYELVEHASGVRGGKRLEPHSLAVATAAAPGGPAANELRPCCSEQEQRTADILQPRLEKVEERLFSPVQVLHQHDGGLIGQELLEKVDPRLAHPVACSQGVQVRRRLEPERQAQDLAAAEPAPHGLGWIALQQTEVLANDLTDGDVRDAPAVGQAASDSTDRFGRLRREPFPELTDQRRLADADVAHDRHEPWPGLLDDVVICRLQGQELAIPADERAAEASHASGPHQRQCADEPATGDSPGLAFRLHSRGLVQFERATDRRGRALADENLSRIGCLLQPRRDVDSVAAHERAAFAGLAHDDISGIHADAQRQCVAEELLEPSLHRGSGVERALRVILQRRGRAERRHYCVAGELLDRAPGVGDLGRHRVIETVEQCARALRVLGAGKLGRAYEVGEEDGRELSLLARGGRYGDWIGAAGAEAGIRRKGLATIRAEPHNPIVPQVGCENGAGSSNGREAWGSVSG